MNENPRMEKMHKALRERLVEIWAAPVDQSPEDSERIRDAAKRLLGEKFGLLTAAQSNPLSEPQVEKAILLLFTEVRKYVLKMRLESLHRLIQYARAEDDCKRKVLLQAMVGQREAYAADPHVCNFCNSRSCVPDLGFKQSSATPAEDSGQHQDIFAAQEDAFKTRDISRLNWAWEEAKRQNLASAFGHKSSAYLEFDPDNHVAHLAAANSYARNPDPNLQQSAHRYYKQYARITNEERKDLELARLGYARYKEFSRTEAIRSYAKSDTVFDDLENISILDRDADLAELNQIERLSLGLIKYLALDRVLAKSISDDRQLQEVMSNW